MLFRVAKTAGYVDWEAVDYLARARIFHLSVYEIGEQGRVVNSVKNVIAFNIFIFRLVKSLIPQKVSPLVIYPYEQPYPPYEDNPKREKAVSSSPSTNSP
jgi:hypothetical protein